jgi:nucleotide-binding universal stress UspA family protein
MRAFRGKTGRPTGTRVARRSVMTIIAATDFSETAAQATHTAARLARKLGDELLVVHVVEPPLQYRGLADAADAPAFDNMLREASQQLMDRALQSLRQHEVVAKGRVVFGPPVPVLAMLAEDEKARLVVMGGNGAGRVARFFLGSVTERTVLAAPCPVLVVPEAAQPFDRWTKGDRPLRVVAGIDLDSAGDAVVAALDELRQTGSCQVSLVHTYWPPGEYVRLGLPVPSESRYTDPEVVAVLERQLQDRFDLRSRAPGAALSIRSAWARPGEVLNDEAEATGADLLVIGTRQPHGWNRWSTGSSAITTLRSATRAVLCVPARPRAAVSPSLAPIPLLRTALVCTDFSDLGNAAVPQAYALVRPSGGVVHLCHVHEHPLPMTPYDAPPSNDDLTSDQRVALERRLEALIPQDAERLGIATHVMVVEGGTAPMAILQAGRRVSADVIVVASHGRSGLGRALVGSVAESVVRGSECPVFVVRRPR